MKKIVIPTYLGIFFLLFSGIESFANINNDSISGVWSLDSIVEKSYENNALIDTEFSGPDTDENVKYNFLNDGIFTIEINNINNASGSYFLTDTTLLINTTNDGSYNFQGNFQVIEYTSSYLHMMKVDGDDGGKVETHFYLTK